MLVVVDRRSLAIIGCWRQLRLSCCFRRRRLGSASGDRGQRFFTQFWYRKSLVRKRFRMVGW